jgi:hypothetical protein
MSVTPGYENADRPRKEILWPADAAAANATEPEVSTGRPPPYWQHRDDLNRQLGWQFHTVLKAVIQAMEETPRRSALVENLNGRLRCYFFLRQRQRQRQRQRIDLSNWVVSCS